MFSPEFVVEFRSLWLPQMSTSGLRKLIQLLQENSPGLVHGAFTDYQGGGCLATHAGWNHPATAGSGPSAGTEWLLLLKNAGSLSRVICEWDMVRPYDTRYPECRQHLLALLREELAARKQAGVSQSDETKGRQGALGHQAVSSAETRSAKGQAGVANLALDPIAVNLFPNSDLARDVRAQLLRVLRTGARAVWACLRHGLEAMRPVMLELRKRLAGAFGQARRQCTNLGAAGEWRQRGIEFRPACKAVFDVIRQASPPDTTRVKTLAGRLLGHGAKDDPSVSPAVRGYPESSPAKPAIISRGRDNGTPDLVCRGPSDGASDEPR